MRVAALGLLLALAPMAAWGQACCTATGAGEFSVVGRCREAVIATQLSYEQALGSYDAEGTYRSLRDAQASDLVLAIGAGVRPGVRSLQIHGSLPLRLQRRALGQLESETSFGPGDAALGLRWTALEDRMTGPVAGDAATWRPFLDLYLTTRVPTGRAPEEAERTSFSDVTGDGAYVLGGGAKVSKFLTIAHVVSLQGGYQHRFDRDVHVPGVETARRLSPGAEIEGRLAYLHIRDLWWSYGAFSSLRWTGTVEEDGDPLPDSTTYRLRFGAHLTWGFDFPLWETSVSLAADPLWSGGAQNVPFGGLTASAVLSRGFI